MKKQTSDIFSVDELALVELIEVTDRPVNAVSDPSCKCASVVAFQKLHCRRCGRIWTDAKQLH